MRFLRSWRRCSVFFLVVLFLRPAWGQSSSPPDTSTFLDLSALLAELATQNPSLQAARLEAEALDTQSRQVASLPDPTFMLTYLPLPIVTARGEQRSQWRVEQGLPYPGKRKLRSDIATLTADISRSEAQVFEADLILRLKEAYYDLYRVQEQDQLIATFQTQLRDFEEAAATRYEVGGGPQQAILKAQLERNRLDIQREQLAAERRTALERLANLLNRADITSLAGRAQVAVSSSSLATMEMLSLALKQRPEVQALHQAHERATRQLDLAQRDFWPDFSVNLTYFDIAKTDLLPTANGRDALAIGAGVKIPLWRDRLRAGREEAEVKQHEVATQIEAMETTIRTHLHDLNYQLERQQEQLALFRNILIPQAETTLEATLSAYTAGRTDFLDLLDAERTLFALRFDDTATFARHLQTIAALERALGVLSLDEVQ